jgi:multiple antibiotic resistance protein
MIIAYMGFDMPRGSHTVGQAPPTKDNVGVQSSLAPLIMFAAGPGTITAVVTMAAVHTPDGLPVTAVVAAVIGAAATFAALLLAIQVGSRLGGGAQAIVTRFMGLIVASMGMQFVLAGTKAFFHV